MRIRSIVVAALVATGLAPAAQAIEIQLDFQHGSFFDNNDAAKAAVEKAAQDLSDVITTSLGATVDQVSGTFGSTTITFNNDLEYTNPYTGATESFNPVILAANEVRIFVGVRSLTGDTLGQGGPGQNNMTPDAVGTSSEIAQALAIAEAAANENFGRGGGPVFDTFSGTVSGGPVSESFEFNLGAMIGNLWFDVDTDNLGGIDDDTTLDDFWHFDHTTAVAADKVDFYTVALHEMLHALGIGSSLSWVNLTDGSSNWTGEAVIALLGDGVGAVVDGSDANTIPDHVADGLLSPRLLDGVQQASVMVPTLGDGERRTLTQLDLAFLQDIGWSVVPEPATGLVLAVGAVAVLTRRRTA